MIEPEMVMRVAKAICRSTGRDPDRACSTPFAGRKALEWEWFSETGRAAIEAMREPIDCMTEACERLTIASRHEARDTWRTMVDVALAEPVAPR